MSSYSVFEGDMLVDGSIGLRFLFKVGPKERVLVVSSSRFDLSSCGKVES